MAEARQAVGFRLGVTPDGGLHFEYDIFSQSPEDQILYLASYVRHRIH